MKKVLFVILLVLASIIIYLDSNYPFLIPESSGWSIGFNQVNNPINFDSVDRHNIISYDSLNRITCETRFLADPFLYFKNGRYFIFFEHQLEGGPAGIAYLESNDGLNYSYKGEVLREKYHLSFPQVFEQNGDIYMIPETASTNQVLLFEAIDFPLEWIIKDTLIKNEKIRDPAVLLTDTLNLILGTDQNYNQRVFKSNSLLGEWKEYSNFKKGIGDEIRPAGNFFLFENNYYVPLQNNIEGYGSGVSLYKLRSDETCLSLELTKEFILKKQDSIIWFNRGMHHLSVNNIGDDNFYLVYDGDRKIEDEKKINWKASLKYNFYEFIEQF